MATDGVGLSGRVPEDGSPTHKEPNFKPATYLSQRDPVNQSLQAMQKSRGSSSSTSEDTASNSKEGSSEPTPWTTCQLVAMGACCCLCIAIVMIVVLVVALSVGSDGSEGAAGNMMDCNGVALLSEQREKITLNTDIITAGAEGSDVREAFMWSFQVPMR